MAIMNWSWRVPMRGAAASLFGMSYLPMRLFAVITREDGLGYGAFVFIYRWTRRWWPIVYRYRRGGGYKWGAGLTIPDSYCRPRGVARTW